MLYFPDFSCKHGHMSDYGRHAPENRPQTCEMYPCQQGTCL